MPIDTAAKRLSVVNFANVKMPPLPSGLVTIEDRYTLLGAYIGLVAAAPLLLLKLTFDPVFLSNLKQSYHHQFQP